MKSLVIALMLCFITAISIAQEPHNEVEVVLKSGRVIRGKLAEETTTTIILQTDSNQIRISKISIKTINGESPFKRRSAGPQSVSRKSYPEDISIPAGDFLMGASRGKDNLVHRVYLNAFRIDTFEVTNAQYHSFTKATGRPTPRYWEDPDYNGAESPVVGVTWEDAQAYCAWVGKRLPTEAEWERAARGAKSRLFPWGDRFDPSHTNTKEAKHNHPQQVGSYLSGQSPDGLFDVAGNVWEWCQDWYDKKYYGFSPTKNPNGPANGKQKVIRGGGWTANHVDMAYRRGMKPEKAYPSLGFRCARSEK